MGARATVWAGGRMQVQDFMPVRGFQSAMYGPLLFGLGKSYVCRFDVDSVGRWKNAVCPSASLDKVQNGSTHNYLCAHG